MSTGTMPWAVETGVNFIHYSNVLYFDTGGENMDHDTHKFCIVALSSRLGKIEQQVR